MVLSLRAEYAIPNIMIGLLLNLIIDYIVLLLVDRIKNWLGNDLIFVIRKFFGVILLAIAVKLFVNNIAVVIQSIPA